MLEERNAFRLYIYALHEHMTLRQQKRIAHDEHYKVGDCLFKNAAYRVAIACNPPDCICDLLIDNKIAENQTWTEDELLVIQ